MVKKLFSEQTMTYNLGTVFILTIGYFFIELLGGLYYNSLALLTDASFMAINITGQLIVLYVAKLSKRPADNNNTFGYERAKVLSGLFNGMLVGFVLFFVLVDSYNRIRNPQALDAGKVFYIALLGLLVNGFGLLKLYKSSGDINIKGAYILILNDALGSVGVIVSSVIIQLTGLYVMDAVTSIFIGLLVAYPIYSLLKGSIGILMEGTPVGMDIEGVRRFIGNGLDCIKQVKDLRVWVLTPEKTIMAARVRTDGQVCSRDEIKALKKRLESKFGFHDVYVEIYEEG